MAVLRRSSLLLAGVLAVVCGRASAQQDGGGGSLSPALPTLWVVGNEAASLGQGLQALFDPAKIHVVDRSEAGGGERSMLENGSWARTLEMVRPGDVVLIDFERGPGATESLPGVSDEMRIVPGQAGSSGQEILRTYGWYLRRYAIDVIAHGATPVLCAFAAADTAAPGAEEAWVKAIAAQQRIAYVDGAAAVRAMQGRPAATAIVAGLKGLKDDPLSGYFSADGDAVPAYRLPEPTGAPATAPPL